jgi:hypothetical protein
LEFWRGGSAAGDETADVLMSAELSVEVYRQWLEGLEMAPKTIQLTMSALLGFDKNPCQIQKKC